MTQIAAILRRTGAIEVEIPAAEERLMGDIRWGTVDAFPTPAYWQYQVIARRLSGRPAGYKLGRTLAEEVGACLLGGHGIPAEVGIAAYERVRHHGAFSKDVPSKAQFETWLREPLRIGGRQVRYRFAGQKAGYLAASLPMLQNVPSFRTGRDLRDWLVRLPGVGMKTASWITRNWMDADDVAILDIHIMRVGQAIGLFPRTLTVERNYLALEELFLQFSQALDVRASELDAVIWYEMASSRTVAKFLIDALRDAPTTGSRPTTRERKGGARLAAQ